MNITCMICGRPCYQDTILSDSPIGIARICPSCYTQYINTCATCNNNENQPCRTYNGPIPRQIMKEIRQGNMVMQAAVENPEFIEVTCKSGCSCFKEDFGCCLSCHQCGNYNGY